VEVVDVVLPLLGAGVVVEVEVPVGVEVPEVEVPAVPEVPLLEEAPVPVFTGELALGSELPEHPLNISIHDRRVTTAAHGNRIVRSA
jgi:hypothetical protein